MLGLEEAQAKLLALAEPLAAETVALADANGRCLAEPLVARRTQPAADLSAMDGYAIGAGDHAGPWHVIGESAAGHPFAGVLGNGEAVRISTGAAMPEGSDAVLLQENAERDGDALSLSNEDGPSASHIRRAGFDFAKGDALFGTGTRLGPAQLALAMMAGHGSAPVHALPALTVIDCGDELVSNPLKASGAQIPATNGTMLAAMAQGLVRECHRIGPVGDSLEALQTAFESAQSEVIVISGGASVGDHDLVKPALEAWGADFAFWRVSVRPGKPLLVATRGEQVILGLPGNPVSAYVTAFLFLLPLLRRLGGCENALPHCVPMRLTVPLPAGGNRTEFVRARMTADGAEPILQRDSSLLHALAQSGLIIRREIEAPEAPAGDIVKAYLLQNGGIA